MRKLAFFVFFIAVCFITSAFGQSNNRQITMGFEKFNTPSSCRAMGLNEEDFSNFKIIFDFSQVKNPNYGLPSIVFITGTNQRPQMGYMGIYKYFAYKSSSPAQITIGGRTFPVGFISLEKRVQASIYQGDVRLNSVDNPGDYCLLKISQQ